MNIEVKPGVYVVAVSGGVDSMVMLDLLSNIPKHKLIVAHFDHGIRTDSHLDRELVQAAAEKYKLPFVFDEGNLGPKTSEAVAREARYKFLEKVVKASGAQAIITAHHQDDLLETAIINLLRGTGRRGLTSLKTLPDLIRPLLKYSKSDILDYAQKHKIKWREDSTNQDTNYLRNYVRHKIMPKFSAKQKAMLLEHIDKLGELNIQIDEISQELVSHACIDRQWFIDLNHSVARDIMANWLRANAVKDIDSKRLELLVRAAKTYQPNKQIDIDKAHKLKVSKDLLALSTRER